MELMFDIRGECRDAPPPLSVFFPFLSRKVTASSSEGDKRGKLPKKKKEIQTRIIQVM